MRSFIKPDKTSDRDNKILKILTNKALIDIDQDVLGKQAKRIKTDGFCDVLAKPLNDGELALCFFNKTSTQKQMSIDLTRLHNDPYINLPITDYYAVTEVWDNVSLTLKGEVSGIVPSHGVRVYRIKAK